MCDATTLISSKQTDLHSCWIIYTKSDGGKERLTVTDTKPMLQPNTTVTTTTTTAAAAAVIMGNNSVVANDINSNIFSSSGTATADDDAVDFNDNDDDTDEPSRNDNEEDDDNYGPDQSFHEMLDPELQPEPPIRENQESQAIYREHRHLAKEYLRVDTKLYYAQDLKEKLLQQMDPAERQEKQELLKKMNEKAELLELYNNLRRQWQQMHTTQAAPASMLESNLTAAATTTTQQSNSNASTNSLPNEIVADDGWVMIPTTNQST